MPTRGQIAGRPRPNQVSLDLRRSWISRLGRERAWILVAGTVWLSSSAEPGSGLTHFQAVPNLERPERPVSRLVCFSQTEFFFSFFFSVELRF